MHCIKILYQPQKRPWPQLIIEGCKHQIEQQCSCPEYCAPLSNQQTFQPAGTVNLAYFCTYRVKCSQEPQCPSMHLCLGSHIDLSLSCGCRLLEPESERERVSCLPYSSSASNSQSKHRCRVIHWHKLPRIHRCIDRQPTPSPYSYGLCEYGHLEPFFWAKSDKRRDVTFKEC